MDNKEDILQQWLDKGKDELRSKAFILTGYAVLPRYPNELNITNDDMRTALNHAKSIQEFVMKILNKSA
ncbi:HEPN domain-containing protein [Treponema sp. R6D11]